MILWMLCNQFLSLVVVELDFVSVTVKVRRYRASAAFVVVVVDFVSVTVKVGGSRAFATLVVVGGAEAAISAIHARGSRAAVNQQRD